MQLLLLSFHIKDVGVEGLTYVGLKSNNKAEALRNFIKTIGASEGFYLSTCNRTEFLFYFEGSTPEHLIKSFDLAPRVYSEREQIVTHLLEVALSKDSVVFGESQILGQFKRAYDQALEANLCGPEISPMLNAVIREAKAIRSRVGLVQCHTSLSTVAGNLLLQKFEKRPVKVFFVGSGETNMILARYLSKRSGIELIWSSRTDARATRTSQELGGTVWPWSRVMSAELPQADILCAATHSPDILVSKKGLAAAGVAVACDLSVPANISQGACDGLGIDYIGIDKLNRALTDSQEVSTDFIRAIDTEVDIALKKILSELHVRQSRSLFAETAQNSERILDSELENLLSSKFSDLQPDEKVLLTEWSRRLVRKINHAQFETLKSHLLNESV